MNRQERGHGLRAKDTQASRDQAERCDQGGRKKTRREWDSRTTDLKTGWGPMVLSAMAGPAKRSTEEWDLEPEESLVFQPRAVSMGMQTGQRDTERQEKERSGRQRGGQPGDPPVESL